MSTKMIPSKNIHICVQEINDFTKNVKNAVDDLF